MIGRGSELICWLWPYKSSRGAQVLLTALPVPKMFQGEHYFQVSERRDGGVRFTQGEHYAGLLEPAFREVMEAVNRHAMTAVNQALKDYLEASA